VLKASLDTSAGPCQVHLIEDLTGIQILVWDKEFDRVWLVHCSFNYSEFIALSFACKLRRSKPFSGAANFVMEERVLNDGRLLLRYALD